MNYSLGDLKRFLMNKINFTMVLVICVFIMQIIQFLVIGFDTNKILKKINHRYFCINTTLEDVHNVNVNTIDGSVRR